MFSAERIAREYTGNNSTTTGYPVDFPYLEASDIKASTLAQGSGTVTVTAGVAVFSSAQATLEVGHKVRIAGVYYEVDTRASDTEFTFTTRPTIAATTFHLPASTVELTSGQYTLVTVGAGAPYVTTASAVPVTSIVRVYSARPLNQTWNFSEGGALPVEEIGRALDHLAMLILRTRADAGLDSSIPSGPSTALKDAVVVADATARGALAPRFNGQLLVQQDNKSVWIGNTTAAGDWSKFSPFGDASQVGVVFGVIRPGAAYNDPWEVLDDSGHTPQGIASITNNSASFALEVVYSAPFAEVYGAAIVPDESLCGYFALGGSIGNSSATVTFRRIAPVCARCVWNGTAWSFEGYNGGVSSIVSAGGGSYTVTLSQWADSQCNHVSVTNYDPGGTLPAGRLTAAASASIGGSNTFTLFLRDSSNVLTVAGGGNTAEFEVVVHAAEGFAVRPQRITRQAYPDGMGSSANLWFLVFGKRA